MTAPAQAGLSELLTAEEAIRCFWLDADDRDLVERIANSCGGRRLRAKG